MHLFHRTTRAFSTANTVWREASFRRQFLDDLGKKLNIQDWQDWYNIPQNALLENGGQTLLKYHNHSFFKALQDLYPEYPWDTNKFNRIPSGYFIEPKNQLSFLEAFAKKYNFKSPDDWYDVRMVDIIDEGGASLLNIHQKSLLDLLRANFPEVHWKPWRFRNKQLWNDVKVQREFLIELSNTLHIRKPEDWYAIKLSKIEEHGGHFIAVAYNKNICNAFKSIFPEYQWDEQKFETVPLDFYDNPKNLRDFFDEIAKIHRFFLPEDFYRIKISDISEKGGQEILYFYNSNILRALRDAYPELEWNINNFQHVNWKHVENQRELFAVLGQKLKIKNWEDWYSLKRSSLEEIPGGREIVKFYDDSHIKAILSVYPGHNWDIGKFTSVWKNSRVPKDFWKDFENVQASFEWASHQLGVRQLQDWFRVPNSLLREVGLGQPLKTYGNKYAILKKIYPDFDWENIPEKQEEDVTSVLMNTLKEALNYNDSDFKIDYSHPGVPNHRMTVYIPKQGLGFEYCGEYKYGHKFPTHELTTSYQAAGVTFVHVPHFWDKKKESLIHLIKRKRNDFKP